MADLSGWASKSTLSDNLWEARNAELVVFWCCTLYSNHLIISASESSDIRPLDAKGSSTNLLHSGAALRWCQVLCCRLSIEGQNLLPEQDETVVGGEDCRLSPVTLARKGTKLLAWHLYRIC